MKNQELIERLKQLEAVMIPSCFKVDMEAVKGQMLELLDKMTLNTMETPDVVAVLEVFLAYLRSEARPQSECCGNCYLCDNNCGFVEEEKS